MFESLFDKAAGLKACNSIKNRLQQALSNAIWKISKNTIFTEEFQ